MKTKIMNSVKALAILMVAFNLLVVASCNRKSSAQHSVSINEKAKTPTIDIHAAAYMGNLDIVKQHIAAGTNLDNKDDYGSTALNTATLFGKTEVALALIAGGADVNLKNNEGSTPLHTAAFFCRPDIAKVLLANGADKELRNNYGSTAYESVAGSFKDVEGIYQQIAKDLGPLGLKLDFDYLKETRPVLAEMLK